MPTRMKHGEGQADLASQLLPARETATPMPAVQFDALLASLDKPEEARTLARAVRQRGPDSIR
jgi:hypothetical protein